LEFMEPWCPHCQNMAPVLDSLYAQYGSGNVVFLSVAGPWNGATAGDAANFIHNYNTYGKNWVYVYDPSGVVFSNYGVNSTPTFFIIGKDGSISSTFQGEQTSDALSGAISAAASS
jgi:cytochrome c-type biogenesis protein